MQSLRFSPTVSPLSAASETRTAGATALAPASPALCFREVTTPADLTALFRLRHRVYAAQGYWAHDPRGLDIDSFDRHSRFIGAWNEAGELVGGARLILPDGEPHQAYFESLGASAPPPRSTSFHSDKLFDFGPVMQFAARQKQIMVEFGRTVMHPEWQRSGLGVQLVHALYGLALRYGVRFGLAAVPPRLTKFYCSLGCRPLGQSGTARAAGIDTDLVPLTVDLQRLDGPLRISLEVARSLRRTGSWSPAETAPTTLRPPATRVQAPVPAPASLVRPPAAVYSWEPPAARLPMLRASGLLTESSLQVGRGTVSLSSALELMGQTLALGLQRLHLGAAARHADVAAALLKLAPPELRFRCSSSTDPREIEAIGRLRRLRPLELELTVNDQVGAEQLQAAVQQAHRLGLEVWLAVPAGGYRSGAELQALWATPQLQRLGVRSLLLEDAQGECEPAQVRALCQAARALGCSLEWRGSDAGGLGLANALVAWECGAGVAADRFGRGSAALAGLLRQLQNLAARPLAEEALRDYESARETENRPKVRSLTSALPARAVS